MKIDGMSKLISDPEKRSVLLEKLGALQFCRICDSDQFTLLESDIIFPLVKKQAIVTSDKTTVPVLPCAIVVCQGCGNITLFDLGTLSRRVEEIS